MFDDRITILYDNTLYNKDLKSGWGFSCIIDHNKKRILFDTGAESETLLYNMNALKINPKTINAIVISHMHHDHTGGLIGLLSYNAGYNENITIHFPSSMIMRKAKKIENKGILKQNIEFVTGTKNITENIYSTGSLGKFIKEQSLVINTGKGLIIITGCAHPGIVDIVEKSIRIFKNIPLFVIGGFHLFSKTNKQILKIIEQFKKMGVKNVSPSHCSGKKARALFKKIYDIHYIEAGVGRVIDLRDLE